MVGTRDHVDQAGERLIGLGHPQTGAHQDVLVGKGQQGAAVLVTEQQPQRLLGLDRAIHGGEGIAPEFLSLAYQGDQNPFLTLLGQEPDVEPRFPVDAQVGHLGQLGIAE